MSKIKLTKQFKKQADALDNADLAALGLMHVGTLGLKLRRRRREGA